VIWDATSKRWQSNWKDQAITLELNDDGGQTLETVKPRFEAALELEPKAFEHLSVWVEVQVPELNPGAISQKACLFHLGCEADGLIWFVYNTGDLLARSGMGLMVTLHDDGRFEGIRFLERN
jgi:hypothetical protein